VLISFSPSVRTADTGSLKRKISEGKGKTRRQAGTEVSAYAEKFFEYKTNAGGAAEAVLRKRRPEPEGAGCSYQFIGWDG